MLLKWRNLPKSWTLANSFGTSQKNQSFRTTIEDFVHAVFIGGDFRIQFTPIGGKPVYTAVRGTWQFSDAAFAEMVQKIIKVEREFWRDYSTPYYLVTLLPLQAPPNVVNTGGSGLTNSFANFATSNGELERFKDLLAHEYFHNWNSVKLGRLKEPETLLYWFSEGFTDYYAYLLLLRSGLITIDEYLQRYNRLIREYYLSPVREASNQRVLQDFWNDDDVHDLPYRRGFLLATNWNALLRRASDGKNSLDDAMLDMLRAAKQNKPELTAEYINEYVSRYAKRSILSDMQRYVENGALILPEKDAFGPYVQMEMVETPLFELGLDLEALRDKKVIAGVVPDSAAYRAGLRDGQVVVRRSPVYSGDSSKPLGITIMEDGRERTIKYYPASRKTVSVPQFKLRSGAGDKERIESLRWLGVS
jgi:predicted metalloprotease with PDZ domain